MNYRLPKAGTRVRALFDTLCRHPNGCVWADVKDAYDGAKPGKSYFHQRGYYSNMDISKYLRKFATHTGKWGKRIYKIKPEWARTALENPFYTLSPGLDAAKLQMAAFPKRDLFAEVNEGLNNLAKHRNSLNPDAIKAGDLVKVKPDPKYPEADRALAAHGIKVGSTYQVSEVKNGFVYISGCDGGWEARRFQILARPPQNQPSSGPQNDKGDPEIRDMAWGSSKVVPNPWTEFLNEQTKTIDPLADLKKELVEAQDEANRWETRCRELEAKVRNWSMALGDVSSELSMLEEVSVSSIHEVTHDLDGRITEVLGEMEESI